MIAGVLMVLLVLLVLMVAGSGTVSMLRTTDGGLTTTTMTAVESVVVATENGVAPTMCEIVCEKRCDDSYDPDLNCRCRRDCVRNCGGPHIQCN